jgi:hypothetical protein
MVGPDWQAIAHALYGLLDDIDTAGDIAKDNDKLYRSLVRQAHQKRHLFAETDGYTLAWASALPAVAIAEEGGPYFNVTPPSS